MSENKRLIIDEYYNLIDTETDSMIEIEDVFDLANELAENYNMKCIECKNLNEVLNDVLNILTEFQQYFILKNDYKHLDADDGYNLYILSCKARDMLAMMDDGE